MVKQRNNLPIGRNTTCLLVSVEATVRCFAYYHRYRVSADLRLQARLLIQFISRALRAQTNQKPKTMHWLILAIGDFKVPLQRATRANACKSFASFRGLMTLAVSLGQQSGFYGICKQQPEEKAMQPQSPSHVRNRCALHAHSGLKQQQMKTLLISQGAQLCHQ